MSCANLQTAINGVTNGGTVTVNQGTCTGVSLTLPSRAPTFKFTIQGAGSGATFNGGAPGNRILTGTDVGIVTLRNLTFENSTAPSGGNGGAVDIEGNSGVTVDSDRFFGNKATGSTITQGGAIHIAFTSTSTATIRNSTFGGTTAASGNSSSGSGGAVSINSTGSASIQVTRSVFRRNTAGLGGGGLVEELNGTTGNPTLTLTDSSFAQNSSADAGGGAILQSSHHAIVVQRNTFSHNSIVSTQNATARGGGLLAIGLPGAPLTQSGNRFDGNHIGQDGSRTTFGSSGGGESVGGLDLTSVRDRYTNNSLAPAIGSGAEAEGGGLGLEGCGTAGTPTDVLKNLVAAGNQIAGEGHGAGVYGGGCSGGTVNARILDSTIAGNRQDAAGGSSGLAGGGADTLKMRNSIVHGNAGADLEGFATRTITNSDACALGFPVSGASNICKLPKLANPGPGHGDVHETTASPTINAGSNLFIPAGLTRDFEGQPRIQNGRVDMGADEFKDAFGGVSITSKEAKVKNGKARVKVRCPKTAVGHCIGKLTLLAKGHAIGTKAFRLQAGKKKTLRVPLTSAGRAQVEQLGKLVHVRARTNAHDDIGTRKRKTRFVDLRLD